MVAGAGLVLLEARASLVSARAFAARAGTLTYTVAEGPAPQSLEAPSGPHDQRLGYTGLPAILDSAEASGFSVMRQARPSRALREYAANGYAPPYVEKTTAGLELRDERGRRLYRSHYPRWAFDDYADVPVVVRRSLGWIEDRELERESATTRNPAIDWSRLARAFVELGLGTVDRDRKVPGGSTLATQIEKFRHSPGGRTGGLADKWRQMVSASTRAYWEGPNTTMARRRIVLGYLNSVPLAAHPRWGEVTGVGEGLQIWFGADPEVVMDLLRGVSSGASVSDAQARGFAQVLSLVVAERRPSFYFRDPAGPGRLAELTAQHARALVAAGVVPEGLARAAVSQTDTAGATPPLISGTGGRPVKAVAAARSRLLPVVGLTSLYDLDRLDLSATVTYDSAAQGIASELLADLNRPDLATNREWIGPTLLAGASPRGIRYSVLLVETSGGLNRVRIDADNDPGATNLNASGRLELGSTAKLRTLVTYLETVAAAYDRYAALAPDSLRALQVHPRDRLSDWVRGRLLERPELDRPDLLSAAMQRRYSADPGESFATGGGVQRFRNFDTRFDAARPTVGEAFRHSINLPFVRILRDVIDHRIFSPASATSAVLSAPDSVRRPYLERFVQGEARTYLRAFDARYVGLDRAGIHTRLAENRMNRPLAVARALRWVDPDLTEEELRAVFSADSSRDQGAQPDVVALHQFTQLESFSLADVAYLTSIHPLELWAARYRAEHPQTASEEVLRVGATEALQVYGWLLDRGRRSRQDPRIYSVLEIDAFEEVLSGWRRLGYPFRTIVPSIGTAIGSSGDRPAALAELTGIIVNDGLRYPLARITGLDLAVGTPYEVSLTRAAAPPEQVMDPAIARLVGDAMRDVVAQGTARGAQTALRGEEGGLVIGAKTGTGDNRSRTSSGGELVRNRTSTLAFFAGDRWFGVVTAYVPGPEAEQYRFTSALSARVLTLLGDRLGPLN